MVLIIAVVAVVIATIVLVRRRARANAASLGWMSERWIAEYRASRS